MVLTLLAVLVAGLLVLATIARIIPRAAVAAGVAGICALVVVVALVALASHMKLTTAELPIGPAGASLHLALDPLGASFLLLLFLVMPCAAVPPLPLFAMALTVLAGDGFTLAVGLLLLGGTSSLRLAAVAIVCLILAFALAGPLVDFVALRAAPPEGWHAEFALWLVLAGAAAFGRISPVIAGYLLLRVVFDLFGTGQPQWWGAPLLLAGAAIAVIGSLRAALADTLHSVTSVGALHQFGMVVMALGVALFARAVDLPGVASGALDAAWLALIGHLLCRTLLLLCAAAVESGAGSRRLDCLGGLIHRMPATAGSCLAGLFALAVLPPGLGFASFWLLFQSLLAVARIGEAVPQALVVGVAAAAGLSVGLIVLASVRLFAVVFLGRPRTPRAAVAEDAPLSVRLVLVGLAAATGLLGVLPALALLPAAGWTHDIGSGSLAILRTGSETRGYSPLAVAGLLAIGGLVLMRTLRPMAEPRREPAWSGGFAAPPSWLPFGDPATQYGPASFTEPLRRSLPALPSIDPVRRPLVRCRDAMLRAATTLIAP